VRKLIEQFDWGSEASPGQRLYVYYIENGKADNIAGVLQELYGQTGDGAQDSTDGAAGFGTGVFRSARELTTPLPQTGMGGAAGDAQQSAADTAPVAADTSVAVESRGPVTIIADPDNNAILVMASPGDYRAIEAAIRKLDIPPRQVLINATIAEVTLSNGLDHGVRWFLDNNDGELGFNSPLPGGAGGEGLTLALFNGAGDVRFFFDLLATESGVKFLSAPQVLVRDNQTATIRVGDQIPVTVRSSSSTINPDSPLVSEVQYRDTGTLLTVTPHINAGGQVTLEVSQEVSLPGTEPAIGGGGNVSIAQRSIDSTVTVQSGQTVVMGGLIREVNTDSTTGIPVLMNVPMLGNLFSSKSKDSNRTELLVTISPVVVEDQHAAQAITRELRNRMQEAASLLENPSPPPAEP
jgi:general secretion pathway protein D